MASSTTFVLAVAAAAFVVLLSSFSTRAAVLPSTTELEYHKGPLLTSPINLYILWYGSFPPTYKSTVSEFITSFTTSGSHPGSPTVASWWKTTHAYKDDAGKPVSSAVKLAGQTYDQPGSLGKSLKRGDVVGLVKQAIAKHTFPFDPTAVYLVLTASDITVEKFCMGSCGFHYSVPFVAGRRAVVAHVGDPGTQCPGLCAWPFAKAAYGPPGPPLGSPNGVGLDGIIMNVATIIAGASTNPHGTGYYQGNVLAPLEAVTACPGVFGEGAYPGYPGKLLVDGRSKGSFNVYGVNNRVYLLPAIWDPLTLTCKAAAV